MSVTYQVTVALTSGGVQAFSKTVSPAGGSDLRISETIGTSGAFTLAMSSDVSQIQALIINAGAATTLVPKSSGTPTQTLTLASDTPIVWYANMGASCPLTADFNSVVATAGESNTLEVFKLEDPTV